MIADCESTFKAKERITAGPRSQHLELSPKSEGLGDCSSKPEHEAGIPRYDVFIPIAEDKLGAPPSGKGNLMADTNHTTTRAVRSTQSGETLAQGATHDAFLGNAERLKHTYPLDIYTYDLWGTKQGHDKQRQESQGGPRRCVY